MITSTGASRVKQRQSNKRDSGSNGEGPDEVHKMSNKARESDKHLEEGAHYEGSLQL